LNDYAVITCSILYAIIIVVTTNLEVRGINVVVVLPVFVSMFYFEARKLLYGCSVTLAFFMALYGLYPPMRQVNNFFDLLVVIGLLVGICTMGFLIMNRGITILRNLERTLESEKKLLVKTIMMDKLTKTDVLTELYNHGTFHNYLSNLIEQCDRAPFPFQLALVDIDNFKRVNDTQGHWTGDLILKRVAIIVKQHLGSNDFAARYGGEEFAVLLLERSLESSLAVMEEIRTAVASTVYKELEGSGITVSIGLRGYEGEGKELFFKRADDCLYEAKRTGKNKVVVFAHGNL
jgi:diguanylate cyclase (GGDEF)-like protein